MASALARTLHIKDAPGKRTHWNDEIADQLAARFAILSSEEAIAQLESAGVWVELCNSAAWPTLRDDPCARAAGLVVEVQDHTYGRILSTFGPPVRFSRSAISGTLRPAPRPGEHTREILAEIGLADEEVEELTARGTVR
jgi:crotonobetainyl-CoA:carnitine CoA-transferase CaiB-like acyl-CoA transferase